MDIAAEDVCPRYRQGRSQGLAITTGEEFGSYIIIRAELAIDSGDGEGVGDLAIVGNIVSDGLARTDLEVVLLEEEVHSADFDDAARGRHHLRLDLLSSRRRLGLGSESGCRRGFRRGRRRAFCCGGWRALFRRCRPLPRASLPLRVWTWPLSWA